MDREVGRFIVQVIRRIDELRGLVLASEKRAGESPITIMELENLLFINRRMLLCLYALRDYGIPVTLSSLVVQAPCRKKPRLFRSFFPIGHPLFGTDIETGEEVTA